MRYAFRPHYRAERFHRKRIDLKILLKVDHIEIAFTSYQSGRLKTVKTHQNEIDHRNIAGAFVCSMRILRGSSARVHDQLTSQAFLLFSSVFVCTVGNASKYWQQCGRESIDVLVWTGPKQGTATGMTKKDQAVSKTTTMHANHAFFVHFYAVTCSTATTCRNCQISRLVESMNTRQRCCMFFVTQKQSFRIQLQKTSPTFDKLNDME